MNHNPNAQNRRPNTNPSNRVVTNDGVVYGSNLRTASRSSQKKRPLTPSERTKVITVVLSAILSALIFMALCLGVYLITYKPDVEIKPDGSKDNPAVAGTVNPPDIDVDSSVGRKKDYYTFLVLGHDNVGYNTDVIMLASFDVKNGEISIMQIPRDTYIEIQEHPLKVNSLYNNLRISAYNEGKADVEKEALEDTVAVLEANMAITIDYYAIVNLQGFMNIVDIIGGVPIDVPFEMKYYDPDQDLNIDIKPGYQILNGEKAQEFIRFRADFVQGDLGRIDAQKIFLTALLKQVKDNLSVSTVVGMINELYSNVRTTLKVEDLTYFAKAFFTIDDASINFISFPGMDVTSGRSYYIMKRADTLSLINRYFNVKTKPITDQQFDAYEIFCSKSEVVRKIYFTPGLLDVVSEYVSNAKNINDEGLYIPLNPKETT